MALIDCNLFRVTATTSCVVDFYNCTTCDFESISVPDGQIYYISHCTGTTANPSVTNGSWELLETSPVTHVYTACTSPGGVSNSYTIHGFTGQFNQNVGWTYYFSAITSFSSSTSLTYPCTVGGCFGLDSTGTTSTDSFYSVYWYDTSLAGSNCSECSTITHPLDPDWFSITGCCYSNFCFNTIYPPYSGYNGSYISAGTYDGYSYYTGGTTPGYIYFFTGGTYWCLSTSLGGSCDLFGASPCLSSCPDICDDLFSYNFCPTPTPTPTINCSLNDFTAIFDCDVIPTPTPTPTLSPTSTPTPTPTPTNNPCNLKSASITVQPSSPTPTPTYTPTPSSTALPRNCVVSGDVTYNTLSGTIICPGENWLFKMCKANTPIIVAPFATPYSFGVGDVLEVYLNFNETNSRCIYFVGTTGTSAVDNIEILNITPSSSTACDTCSASVPSPTPTGTLTPTPSVTMTMTPSSTIPLTETYFAYRFCDKTNPSINKWVVQTINVNPSMLISDYFAWLEYNITSPSSGIDWVCIEYAGSFTVPLSQNINIVSQTFVDTYSPGVTNLVNLYIGNFFTSQPTNNGNLLDFGFTNTGFDTCERCSGQLRPVYVYALCPDLSDAIFQYVEVNPQGVTLSPTDGFSSTDNFGRQLCWVYVGTYLGDLVATTGYYPVGAPPQPFTNYTPIGHISPDFFNNPFIGVTYTLDLDPNTGLPYVKCINCGG